jgi:hypothetical protein
MWQTYVNKEILTGDDAVSAASLNIIDIAQEVVEDAYHQNRTRLIHWWYRLLLPTVLKLYEPEQWHRILIPLGSHYKTNLLTSEFLQEIMPLRRVKELYFQTDAHTLIDAHGLSVPIAQSVIDRDPEFIPLTNWWDNKE